MSPVLQNVQNLILDGITQILSSLTVLLKCSQLVFLSYKGGHRDHEFMETELGLWMLFCLCVLLSLCRGNEKLCNNL